LDTLTLPEMVGFFIQVLGMVLGMGKKENKKRTQILS